MLQINEFHYDPESDLTFNNWFNKCQDVFRKDLADDPEEKRVRLLLRRLGTAEYRKLKSYIRPKELDDLKFEETVSILCDLFGEKSSAFRKCFKCLSLTKTSDEG